MKKPLLIDHRLDNFNLGENNAILINPNNINIVEYKKAKITVTYEKKEGDEESEIQELEGYNTKVITNNSPRDRFSNFFTTMPDPDWLKRNADRIGLSKIFEDPDTGNMTFINKENIIDIHFTRFSEEERKENGKKEVELIMFFLSPQPESVNHEEKPLIISGYNNLLPYSIEIDVKEELKNEKPYTIINDFFNSF